MPEGKYLGLDVGYPSDTAAIIDAYLLIERDPRLGSAEEQDEINLHNYLQEVVDKQPDGVKDLLEVCSQRSEAEARGFAAYAAKVAIAHYPEFVVRLVEKLSQDKDPSVRNQLVDMTTEIFRAPNTWQIAEHLNGRQLVRIRRAEETANDLTESEIQVSSAEPVTQHLDSRRLDEEEIGREYLDYVIRLDDIEAVESSPYRLTLEALRELGLTELIIEHPRRWGHEDFGEHSNKWNVDGVKKFPDTKSMFAEAPGGELAVYASILPTGERGLQAVFGGDDYHDFDPEHVNEMIWGHLETIHNSLSNSSEGRNLPIAER